MRPHIRRTSHRCQQCAPPVRLTRARGIRGEVAAEPLAATPDRFSNLQHVHLRDASGSLRELALERVWEHKGQLIFKFGGIDDRNAAETLG